MLHVLKLKFQPGTSLAQVLEQTGDAFLVEHTPRTGWDSLWADNHIGDGTNWLGLQLMMVRAMLKGADDTTRGYSMPTAIWILIQVNALMVLVARIGNRLLKKQPKP